MRLVLMRHASTRGNELRRYVGRGTDEPLSRRGLEQCREVGELAWDGVVFASPMRRVVQTATLCFPHARVETAAGLEEFDFGAFEGRSARDMERDGAYRAWVDGGCRGRCPRGESRAEFVARSSAAVRALLLEAAERDEGMAVVVAHGGTVMAALHELGPRQRDGDGYFSWAVGPCEGYVAQVGVEDGGVELVDPVRASATDWAGIWGRL